VKCLSFYLKKKEYLYHPELVSGSIQKIINWILIFAGMTRGF